MKNNKLIELSFLIFIFSICISLNGVHGANPNDYIEIPNANASVHATFVYGDYFYVVNGSDILKYYLEDGTQVDSYEITDTISQVSQTLEKAGELYIRFTRSATEYVMCFDLETFTELNRTLKANIDNYGFNDDVWNWVYWEINDIGYWFYSRSWSYAPSTDAFQHMTMHKGNFDEILPYTNYGVYSIGHGYSANSYGVPWYHAIYMFNTNDSSTTAFSVSTGNVADHKSIYSYNTVYWNGTHWIQGAFYADIEHNLGGGSQNEQNYWAGYEDNYNLQSIFDEDGNSYATFGRFTIRGKLGMEGITVFENANNKGVYFWDCEERVFGHVDYWGGSTTGTFHQAVNTVASGFIGGWSSWALNYEPRLRNNLRPRQFGSVSFGYYETYTGYDNYYIGYVNQSDLVPIAEIITVPSGNPIVSSFDYDNVEQCYIYESPINLVATFTLDNSTSLFILRNLIDRSELASGGYTTPTLQFIDADLFTIIGGEKVVNDGWLFMGEMYQIESTIQNMTTYYLEIDDGVNTVKFFYNNETKSLNITGSEQFISGLIYGEVETVNVTIDRYLCKWRFILNRNIVDNLNITIRYYGENPIEGKTTEGTAISGLKIYNLGGYADYEFGGDGGKVTGGDIFEVQAENGTDSSYAYAEMIFRKLQHFNTLVEFDLSNEWDAGNGIFDIEGAGYFEFGIDYRLESAWVEGWSVRIYPTNWNVGHHNGAVDHNWVGWQIEWFNRGVQIKEDIIYTNHWGYDNENAQPDYHINRTSTQMWIDLWFNRGNASTVIGGRVNSYYYGMYEQGSAWWFGYGTFRPMFGEVQVSMFFDDLKDSSDDVFSSQELELIKLWVKVTKMPNADADDETWYLKNYALLSWKLASDRMEGVDTPILVETKVLDMPQTGFINALRSAINGIATSIWKGAFGFLKLIMSSIGYLMEAIGLGAWWEYVSIMIGNIATASTSFMNELETALLNSALLLEQIFRLISNGLTRWTYGITQFISSMLSWYTHIVQMFTGGGIWTKNIWVSLSLEDWLILGIHLLPVFWLDRLSKSDDLLRTAQGDLSFVVMLTTGLFNFLASVIMLSIALLSFLIGLLPI